MFGDDTYTVFSNPVAGKPNEDITANVRIGIRDFLIQQNWVNVGRGYGYCGVRIENDEARVAGFVSTLPQPPAGQDYHPTVYGATYRADIDYENTGDTTFRDLGATGEQYMLGSRAPQDSDFFGVGGRVALGTTVAPGATHRCTSGCLTLFWGNFAPVGARCTASLRHACAVTCKLVETSPTTRQVRLLAKIGARRKTRQQHEC